MTTISALHSLDRTRPGALTVAIFGFAALALPVQAQPELLWVRTADGADSDVAFGVAAEPSGGAYISGGFHGTVDLDGDGTTDITSVGDQDIFLARYDAEGTLLWARSAGGIDFDEGYRVATAPDGGAYLTGSFDGSADFDGDGVPDVTGIDDADAFLAHYGADGSLLWVRATGAEAAFGTSVAAGSDGGAYLIGTFGGTADFDGDGTPDVTAVSSEGDIFLARYGLDGAFLWARSAGGDNDDFGLGVAVGPDDGAYITGDFYESADFNGDGVADVTGSSGSNIFLARYGPDGEYLWVRSADGADEGSGLGIAVQRDEGAYLAGRFLGEADFNDDGTPDVTSAGGYDAFLARYDSDGALHWVRSAGGIGEDESYGVALGADGSVFVTGYFSEEADFDGDGEPDATSSGQLDVFLAAYDAAGELLWVHATGGVLDDGGYAVALGDGSAFVAGYFDGEEDFDSEPVAGDAFLARYATAAVAAEPAAPEAAAALSAPHPNPFRQAARLTLTLDAPQHVTVEVLDMLGRRITVLHEGVAPASDLPLALDAAGLPAGLYVVRATGETFTATQRVTVVR